jgi:YD repeat-containing protein
MRKAVWSKTDALGNVSKTEYNAAGQVIASIDTLGGRTSYKYSPRRKLGKIIYPDGTNEFTEFDANGNAIAHTDRQGRTTRFEFDVLKRPIKTTAADGSYSTTEYDAAGRMTVTVW